MTETNNNKHVKATPVTAKQYLKDQVSKNTMKDTLENIVKTMNNKHNIMMIIACKKMTNRQSRHDQWTTQQINC